MLTAAKTLGEIIGDSQRTRSTHTGRARWMQDRLLLAAVSTVRVNQTLENGMYNDLVPEYNSRIDSIATQSQQAASVLDEPACTHCLAPYGHKINCPLINREAAEQRSVQLLADIIRMRALGVLY